MKPVIVVFFFLTISTQNKAQEYNYFHYDIKDGLSGIDIYSIVQDKDGFLWFATETGLSRFDGSHFKNYAANEGLNENEIINLFVDSKNRVWVFPFKNSIYYYYNGRIHNASNDSLLNKFHLKNEIFKACEDKNGNIFFLEADRLHILLKNSQLIEKDKLNGKDFYNNGCGIQPDGNCNFFISIKEDISNHRIESYEYKNSQMVFKAVLQDYDLNRNALEINAGYTLIRNADHFEIFNQKNWQKFKIKVPDHFHSVSYIDDSSFIVSTSEKAFLFSITNKQIIDSFLIHKTVNKCFKDNEGNLWFATMAQGAFRLPPAKVLVYTLENDFNTMPVYALTRNGDHLYMGSGKILLWDLYLKKNTLNQLKIKTDYNTGRISAIESIDNKTLLLGCDNGILKINGTHTLNYFRRTSVKSMFIHNDSIIIASDRNVFETSLQNFKYANIIWNSRATCACKFNNQYYIGTLNSLLVIENNLKHTTTDLGNIFPALKKKIVAIVPAPNGDIWIATASNGVVCLRNNKILYHITTKNGLTSNTCRCLYLAQNVLWLGTDKGICKIDFMHYPFTVSRFTAAEGLDCEIINCIYAEGDSVFAGTPFGVTLFNAGKIQNKSVCELRLVNIQSKNNNWYYKQDNIHLTSNDNFLQFNYAGISLVSTGDITYYYQLKGLDNIWQSTKQNSVEFESLPPGDYTFNMYAINKYGTKSNSISVTFTKAKTFWQLLWVQGILIIFAILLIGLLFRMKIKSIKKNASEKLLREKRMYELEQMALRSQMNPHFIFNSLNSIQQYIFSGNAVEANQFITNFSLLIRQTFYISGKKFITLTEEINYLNSYLTLEQAKYENIFDFQILYNDEVISGDIVMPPLLLQPYIENSIRHGILNMKEGCGSISVYFKVKESCLICIIEDNGIGRENAVKLKGNTNSDHQSKGMELVEKRIESLNSIYNVSIVASIQDIMEENKKGTRVTVKLPLSYDEY